MGRSKKKSKKPSKIEDTSNNNENNNNNDNNNNNNNNEINVGEEQFPIAVRYRPEVGRYMVTTRAIPAGSLLFRESALVSAPSHDLSSPCCLECWRQLDLETSYRCEKCAMPMCDEMCALQGDHAKNECKILAKIHVNDYLQYNEELQSFPIYWSIAVLRVLCLNKEDFERIEQMMDHLEEQQSSENWQLYEKYVINFVSKICGLEKNFDVHQVRHVLAALDVNSVRIAGPRTKHQFQSGHALFAKTALLSHSCLANSRTLIQSDRSCECRATVDLAKGEEITKLYVNPLETTNKRRDQLRKNWHFECKCPRCESNDELGICTSCTKCLRCGGTMAPLQPLLKEETIWQCQDCGNQTSSEAVRRLESYFRDQLASTPKEHTSAWEKLLEQGSRMLHPHHAILLQIRLHLNALFIQLPMKMGVAPESVPAEVYLRRKELLDAVHEVVERVEPGLTRRRGLSLLEVATCHLQLGRTLHQTGRFATEDFAKLLKDEAQKLRECIACLSGYRADGSESESKYRAECALAEAEHVARGLGVMDEVEEIGVEDDGNRINEIEDIIRKRQLLTSS